MKNDQKLTALTSAYKLKAGLAITAIVLFFLLFLSMVAAFAYLTYYSVIFEITSINKLTILAKIGAIAGSAMLLIFSVKFLFKLKNHKPTNRIKLHKDEHPDLWLFVDEICAKTGAPKPKNIFVDPDVNAYVSYTNSWQSLFLPTKKELTIGMALVDTLNHTEFKAVVSHEFGHFAQSSMKIGSYIMSANTIIHDMIFNRDKWDELLVQWRSQDFRLSAAAWLITPMVWIVRQLLSLFYRFLNIMYSSLSREMEFNADKVAVSVCGTDAILSALWKLDYGAEVWNKTMDHAYLAAQKRIFTDNLFTHNGLSLMKRSEKMNSDYQDLAQDTRGGKLFFTSSATSKTGMYASHPPNDKRQESAKVPFIPGETDERTPWLLFGKVAELQMDMTTLVYREYLGKTSFTVTDPTAFEKFIKAETQDSELAEEYFNTFSDRFFRIPSADTLGQSVSTDQPESALASMKIELIGLMKPMQELKLLMQQAQEIDQGVTTQKQITYQGKDFTKKNLNDAYQLLLKDHEQLANESFIDWDQRFCQLHIGLARDEEEKNQLLLMYNQHRVITQIYEKIIQEKNAIYTDLAGIQANSELTQTELADFGTRVQKQVVEFNTILHEITSTTFVPLPNIASVKEFKNAVIEGGTYQFEKGNIFENGGFDRILQRVEQTVLHLNRLEQKSIYQILAFQKKLMSETKAAN